MVPALSIILIFQLVGEVISRALHLPLPSGWWLQPALALGTGIWGLLIAALIG